MGKEVSRLEFMQVITSGALGWAVLALLKEDRGIRDQLLSQQEWDYLEATLNLEDMKTLDRNSLARDLDLLNIINMTRMDMGLPPIEVGQPKGPQA